MRRCVDALLQWLRWSTRSRFRAARTGVASAVLLQSATAVAGFVSSGAVASAVGLVIFPGADTGSAVVAKILLVRLSVLAPLFLLIGVGLFMRMQEGRVENIETSNIHHEPLQAVKCANLAFFDGSPPNPDGIRGADGKTC
ncbi:hypothetical protein [Loktanella sp. M215]|uniref:hypothetical protein n=1 Tax=Loktanella sp. M215 TaxID=2675431 RepID=UPI001F36A3E8|nr:hypothetical protein [Loktanella sp. M215]MCF7700771.1 hypothetical protein [Loktanella sp. M215]